MIFAAGLGTRLAPLTNEKPKALVEVHGVPLLELVIKRLRFFGYNDLIINVHHFPDMVLDFLKKNKNFGASITISDERDFLLDTGGGLKKVAGFFDNKPFLVHNVDVISNLNLQDLYQFHIQENALATLAVKNRKTSRYFLFDGNFNMLGWKNMKSNEIKITRVNTGKFAALAFSGIHVISPEIFNYITQEGKFSITELYLSLSSQHKILGYQCEESFWMDLGNVQNLANAEEFFKNYGINRLTGEQED